MTPHSLADPRFPLYQPGYEHDGCGVGFVADTRGAPRHDLLRMATDALANLTHRGAVDADTRTGDGAGVLFALPATFFANLSDELRLPRKGGPIGVGVFFLPRHAPDEQHQIRRLIADILHERGFSDFAWRPVPTRPAVLGLKAAATMPRIEQLVLPFDADIAPRVADQRLYALRRTIESRLHRGRLTAYIASMSARTIVYKGLMMGDALAEFYPDLQRDLPTNFALFHQRFSTNTFPSWSLAQPFRMLAHNGEINTILGNANGTRLRQADLHAELWNEVIDDLKPVLQPGFSDSAHLDNVAELLTLSSRSPLHTLTMLVPQAWEHDANLSPEVRAFFDYHASLNEPWDGPAAITYADGRFVGAHLDRNGLRPLRVLRTHDDLIYACSEVGVLNLPEERIAERSRLGPGHMIAVDLQEGRVLTGDTIKPELARRQPYQQWLDENLIRIPQRPVADTIAPELDDERRLRLQTCFAYSREEFKLTLEPMATTGKEAISSMGDDTPIAALSLQQRPLAHFFKQRFAQVTNPPIDPIRERHNMSLSVHLGRRRNWLTETPAHARQVALDAPVLTAAEMQALHHALPPERIATLDATFPAADGPAGLKKALDTLSQNALDAIAAGAEILIVSDRQVAPERAPIPMLLAVGALGTDLLKTDLRLRASLIVESAEPRDSHFIATLLGFGASAVFPYLAIETLLADLELETSPAERIQNFLKSQHLGLLKIMSKMGISVLGSYRGAQIFEAIGLGPDVVERAFPNTPSPIAGLTLDDLAEDALLRHARAFEPDAPDAPVDLGLLRFRRSGETHAWSPQHLGAMNRLRKHKPGAYATFTAASAALPPLQLRDLLQPTALRPAIPLDEVEPTDAICRRFSTAAMSLGSLSPEAHRALAVAMNRLGARSNTGEGGEDPERYTLDAHGDDANARIKQIASGRFGVSPLYLVKARELEIKMAQGAKPGEGGQLPGHKVTPYIAYLRHATPGVPLISPPPHHDIYSIEDLAQLIYDLKAINPQAEVCVKLVATAGVGTIAAGVAKALADTILISGHDGGTGASPVTSVKNAGIPWEIGLAETQQTLRLNGLRERVKLRVDGGLKTGRDIIIAALLGAEEFNFGTAALVALGCRYVRQCHLDTCPVGIATQREDLRKKFEGDPDMIVAYFQSVAQEVRELLSQLGAPSLDAIIGRSDLLKHLPHPDHPRAHRLDLSPLMAAPDPVHGATFHTWPGPSTAPSPLNARIARDCSEALSTGQPLRLDYPIANTDRTTGARLSGLIALQERDTPLPEATFDLHFKGTAGQSFGAFLNHGVALTLRGAANDYVAKGMGGGRIVITPDADLTPLDETTSHHTLAGNTLLYGATAGELFIAGLTGERFAVRNSGALSVTHGTGDYACEYMTGGICVFLGPVGHHFAAGMTGGLAFVHDPHDRLPTRTQASDVELSRPAEDDHDTTELHRLIARHFELTKSPIAEAMLADWPAKVSEFYKVTPRAILALKKAEGVA
ncbi:glutamate synthase large subunit [Lujinxingia sediminis]|uniref:Glutamate synthase large subunit n=1 Tax=Lujinxingia sediminis TaxID=2480984 RepID=A0ABY0CUP9_9DELT|nr:glutamate synthase large subunit [Lujinxingia sediminis]RVU45765.1 glutamate synthase large subunit [Lujinxingia sediminis]